MAQIIVSPQKGKASRDEMNLAEFPLTVLSTRSDSKIKTLEFSDSVRGKNGEAVERKWIITGADKFGLPTSSDDEVLLGLLKLTVDDGIKERKVYFTRYELLKILRWTTEGRSYSRLQKALDRLSGVRIKATNAFYDNDSKAHSTKNFGIIDAYEINDGRDVAPKSSFFTWSEALFKSFQVGFIKKLDLDFYLDLESAVSKRLYRFLDKHFWYKPRVQYNLFVLAHEKIGVSRSYIYASSIRQQLDPAIEELMECGFISACEYVGKGRETEIILHAGKQKSLPASGASRNPQVLPPEPSSSEGGLFGQVAGMLVQRGLTPEKAESLLAGKNEAGLKRALAIVNHFDDQMRKGKINKSPTGFLIYAITKGDDFSLKGDSKRQQGGGNQLNFGISIQASRSEERQSDDSAAKAAYLVERKLVAQRAREQINPKEEWAFRSEVEAKFIKVRRSLSEERFENLVNQGLEEKLLKAVNFPTFEDWAKLQKTDKI